MTSANHKWRRSVTFVVKKLEIVFFPLSVTPAMIELKLERHKR